MTRDMMIAVAFAISVATMAIGPGDALATSHGPAKTTMVVHGMGYLANTGTCGDLPCAAQLTAQLFVGSASKGITLANRKVSFYLSDGVALGFNDPACVTKTDAHGRAWCAYDPRIFGVEAMVRFEAVYAGDGRRYLPSWAAAQTVDPSVG